MQQPGAQLADLPISTQTCMELVDRVAASQEFRRAARLREFLVYVCSQTLEHGASVIHEQEIGEAVFGRPRSYDTNVDNIVRVNATSLRKRLEHYFAEEGILEDLILEIPRGSYTPVFRQRTTDALTLDRPTPFTQPDLTAPILVSTPTARSPWTTIWAITATLFFLITLALLWQNRALDRQLQRWKAEPALHAFWGNFFAASTETDVVLADTSFALAEDIMQRTISLSDYLNYNYKRFAEAPAFSPDQRHDLSLVLDRNNGSTGDFRVAQRVLALNAGPARGLLKFSRDYTTDEAKYNSVVLIGSQESNPWVGLFADKLNFALQYDPVNRQPFVTNRTPHSGEKSTYATANQATPANPDPPGTGYGVIAYLPNLSGKGHALILEGTDSQATGAAGEFITTEDALAAFAAKFPPGPIPSFEILLRTSQLSGTPLQAEIVASRIYPDTKPSTPSH